MHMEGRNLLIDELNMVVRDLACARADFLWDLEYLINDQFCETAPSLYYQNAKNTQHFTNFVFETLLDGLYFAGRMNDWRSPKMTRSGNASCRNKTFLQN